MPVCDIFTQDCLSGLFPPQRTDAFFEALFGGAEDGAYDICLTYLPREQTSDGDSEENEIRFAFELRQRPGHCLACNLTHGLPQVFERHPIINLQGLIEDLSQLAGWDTEEVWWRIGATETQSAELHRIPFILLRHKSQADNESS